MSTCITGNGIGPGWKALRARWSSTVGILADAVQQNRIPERHAASRSAQIASASSSASTLRSAVHMRATLFDRRIARPLARDDVTGE